MSNVWFLYSDETYMFQILPSMLPTIICPICLKHDTFFFHKSVKKKQSHDVSYARSITCKPNQLAHECVAVNKDLITQGKIELADRQDFCGNFHGSASGL